MSFEESVNIPFCPCPFRYCTVLLRYISLRFIQFQGTNLLKIYHLQCIPHYSTVLVDTGKNCFTAQFVSQLCEKSHLLPTLFTSLSVQGYSPGYSPGAAATAFSRPQVDMDPRWMQISSRAAGWTSRLDVFKKVSGVDAFSPDVL